MLSFLLPLASKIISDAVNKIPENEELGEKTDMDDQLLEVVTKAIKSREE